MAEEGGHDIMSHSDNWCALMTFQEQELCKQATRIALWGKSQRAHWVFDKLKLRTCIWLVKIGH